LFLKIIQNLEASLICNFNYRSENRHETFGYRLDFTENEMVNQKSVDIIKQTKQSVKNISSDVKTSAYQH